ncbi:MAG: 3-dehydroquinate synthase [Muribaculum sp.]|nr:3-dehydroquinate synthase [Muribaculum sp.]
MSQQNIIFTNDVAEALHSVRQETDFPSTWILTDENTRACVADKLGHVPDDVRFIVVKPGDSHKDLASLSEIWGQLQREGATRKSLMINLGGGVVTDMGGFAAATFKRGIRFVNVPTTLLAAVDAAVGGKTGVNFNGFKNEIGVFCEAQSVIISTCFFDTLPPSEVWSGYAEMLKHGLLAGRDQYSRLLALNPVDCSRTDLLSILRESVEVKRRIVAEDPHERGLRKALNLGHTVGHAFESLALKRCRPVPHGYAVAWGCVVELILSHLEKGFPSGDLHKFASYVLENYGAFYIDCDDYPSLLEFMRHDKKNDSTEINFTLLHTLGDVVVNCVCGEETIKNALDIYRDLMRI